MKKVYVILTALYPEDEETFYGVFASPLQAFKAVQKDLEERKLKVGKIIRNGKRGFFTRDDSKARSYICFPRTIGVIGYDE